MKIIITMFLQLVYLLLIPVAYVLSPVLPFFVKKIKMNPDSPYWSYYILGLPVYLSWFMSEKDAPSVTEEFNPHGNGYHFTFHWFLANPANGFFVKYLQD